MKVQSAWASAPSASKTMTVAAARVGARAARTGTGAVVILYIHTYIHTYIPTYVQCFIHTYIHNIIIHAFID